VRRRWFGRVGSVGHVDDGIHRFGEHLVDPSGEHAADRATGFSDDADHDRHADGESGGSRTRDHFRRRHHERRGGE
jgi:hypothetical protein